MNVLTANSPKCLTSFRGRTLLDGQLSAFGAIGLDDIGIVTGYLREQIRDRGAKEFYNARWAESNMVISLACADAWLASDVCLVSYSDIFYEPRALELLAESAESIAITYDPNWLDIWRRRFADPLSDAESFRLAANGSLLEIGGRAARIEDVEGQYMGLLRIDPVGWAAIRAVLDQCSERERAAMHMTGLLQRVVAAGACNVAAISYDGEWGEIDSPSDLAAYPDFKATAEGRRS